ncbi:MAG: hypothetical protein JNK64_20900 [Myxococcales bacterium]|nr:hypothetical protein [Myxococcales bacterium]
MPNPQPHPEILNADATPTVQRLLCARRRDCLMVAAKRGWQGFTCNACDAFEQPTRDELAAEREMLAALGMVLARPRGDSVATMAEAATRADERPLVTIRPSVAVTPVVPSVPDDTIVTIRAMVAEELGNFPS